MQAIQTFGSWRSLAPAMIAFAVLALLEMLVVHLLVALASPVAAVVLSILSLGFFLWLLALIHSLRRCPSHVSETHLLLRLGILRSVEVAVPDIAAVSGGMAMDAPRKPGRLRLSLIAAPNVHVVLKGERMERGRPITEILLCVDEPAGFVRAVEAAMEQAGERNAA